MPLELLALLVLALFVHAASANVEALKRDANHKFRAMMSALNEGNCWLVMIRQAVCLICFALPTGWT